MDIAEDRQEAASAGTAKRRRGTKSSVEIEKVVDDDDDDDDDDDARPSEDKVPRAMSVEGMRERLQQMQEDALDRVNDRLNCMVSEVMRQLETVTSGKASRSLDHSNEYCDRRKSSKDGILPDKQFFRRNSLLTDLFEVNHIRTIYNIFVAILILLILNTAVHDVFDTGSTSLGVSTIMLGFGKFTKVVHIWLVMMISTCVLYAALSLWAHRRVGLRPKSRTLKAWDSGWLMALTLYQIAFVVLPVKSVLGENLPPASSLVVLMEQVRMMMKTHAFVRSTAPYVLARKPHAECYQETCPRFSKFLYFMFAPTLVYRNDYPRTKKINWRAVVVNYAEVVLVVFYVALVFERSLIPVFRQFGTGSLEPRALILTIFGTMMPGILIFLCGFYCLLHAWMNASAEWLRFGDRMFYKDWWNSTSYDAYYRTWNVVVHDWLYAYIYKDMYEIVTPRNKVLSTFVVFFVSAIFHEYILAFAFRFFYPVLMLMFGGVGLILAFVTRKHARVGGNVFMWLTLCIGTGILLSLYSMEYYARINCSPYQNELLDLLLPRSWICHGLAIA